MTKAQEHKLIIWALLAVAIAIIIWLLLQPKAGAAQPAATPAATPSAPATYVIPALTIPGNNFVINAPPGGLPNVYNIGAPTVDNYATNGDCSCGCGSGGSASTTYSFGAFNADELNIFDQLQTTAQAADSASMTALLQSFGYNEGVSVSNATPTPWAVPNT